MNLLEITKLINSIPEEDYKFKEFYTKKRQGLVDEINMAILETNGGRNLSLYEMLLATPEPDLAETVVEL